MSSLLETMVQEMAPPSAAAADTVTQATGAGPEHLGTWVRGQAMNSLRHATALRPFTTKEFGTGIAAPSEGHVGSVNTLIAKMRTELLGRTKKMKISALEAAQEPSTVSLQRLLRLKEHTHHAVQAVERIWDFYLELFGQRQGQFGEWLVGCDRIALDCYQAMYMGVGVAKTIPAPPPFAYMRTGFSPATFRRGIFLRRLGQPNPFPLVQLPYHRLVNPWTLGAVLHELCHNLQSDLGLARAIPLAIARKLLKAGMPQDVVRTWVRWNRETYADLNGLLLGGPAIVASLMDVVGRSPATVTNYLPKGPHPTPRLRTLISIELLRRMGFEHEANHYSNSWRLMYPINQRGNIPTSVWKTFPTANRIVVDTICYQPYKELGNKSLAQVTGFSRHHQQMMEEAAGRLAAGNDPGVVPARFLIGAARIAMDRKLAKPSVIASHFYQELARR
jgi:hypothetical protein